MRKLTFTTAEDDDFHKELGKRIRKYFKSKGKHQHADWTWWLKIGLFFSTMLTSYFLILFQVVPPLAMLGLAFVFSFSITMIGFNIAHDAGHMALSRKKWVNKFFFRAWDLIGVSSYFWNIKHNNSHHSFTNVLEYDADITQVTFLRVSPTVPLEKKHRNQHIYGPLLYPVFFLFLIFYRDFKLLFMERVGSIENIEHPKSEVAFMIFSKLFFAFYAIVIPILVLPISPLWIIFAFVISQMAVSGVAMLILAIVHLSDHTNFTDPGEDAVVHRSWAMQQVHVCHDFGTASPLLGWFCGGLNFHLIHHLFPNICHVHYYPLNKILKETIADYGLSYHSDSWPKAVQNHFLFLKRMGREEQPY